MAIFNKDEIKGAISKLSVSAKDAAENVIKATKEGANTVAKKSEELVEISKLNININAEKGRMSKIYTEIGEIISEKYNNGVYIDPDVVSLCEKIKENLNYIHEMEEKLSSLKKIKTCINCGEKLSQEINFCSKCGTEQSLENSEPNCTSAVENNIEE